MILMLGMDHTIATIDQRSMFAFTNENIKEIIPKMKNAFSADGVVILSTCNRFELWISATTINEDAVFDFLAANAKNNTNTFISKEDFVIRFDEDAVQHLFQLSCGMESAIFAEDQILTQVKNAAALSRNMECIGSVLEVLFRMAVTSAKKIKSQIKFSRADTTAIDEAIFMLQKNKWIHPDSKCMVIGNGEMGQISAMRLKNVCDDVSVTVRQYHSGEVKIPKGCARMDYGKRMDYIPSCDIVVSATASPHYTIKEKDLEACDIIKPLVLIDLAVPRDIDPAIEGRFENISIFNIDDFKTSMDDMNISEKKAAQNIIMEEIEAFYVWLHGRDIIPRVQSIQSEAADDFVWRMQKLVKKMDLQTDDKEKLNQQMSVTVQKVIGKLLFTLRSNMTEEAFLNCIQILENNQ